jgi:hypothetical protein
VHSETAAKCADSDVKCRRLRDLQGIEAYDQQPDQMDVLLDQFLEQRESAPSEAKPMRVVR